MTSANDDIFDDSVSVASARQIDALGDEFEQAWRRQEQPKIEAFLSRVPAQIVWPLLLSLLKLDCSLRGLQPDAVPNAAAEYASRFPQFADRIRDLFDTWWPSASSERILPAGAPPTIVTDPPTGVRRFAVGPRTATRLGKYKLLAEVGRGGMGIVFKARQPGLDRDVALKVLLELSAEAIQRFKDECRISGRLTHPVIVQAYDADVDGGVPFLVMEFVEGVDLDKISSACGEITLADACELVRQAALGLQYAHAQEMVHRDIKPSNLMLSKDGSVKILDLGLARLRSENLPARAESKSGALLGTFSYMAPEQAVDPHNVDIRADVYSLGCTLFRLLAARPPYGRHNSTAAELLYAHRFESIPDIRQFAHDVPDELFGIISAMLAKSPDDRPRTPDEVAWRLAPFVDGSNLRELAGIAMTELAHRAGRASARTEVRQETVADDPTKPYSYPRESPPTGKQNAPRSLNDISGVDQSSDDSSSPDSRDKRKSGHRPGKRTAAILCAVLAVAGGWWYSHRSIPLLPRAGFERAIKSAGWSYSDTGIESPDSRDAWLRVTGGLPDDFRIRIVAERLDGDVFWLIHNSEQSPFVIAVSVAETQLPAPASQPPKQFAADWGNPSDLTAREFAISVKAGQLHLEVNGRVQIDWRDGFAQDVDLPPGDIPVSERGFYLQTSGSRYRFQCYQEPVR